MPPTTQPANPAARNTFDVRPLVGAHFNNPAQMRVESAAVAMEGRRLFVGTADGCLNVFDVDPLTGSATLLPASPGRVSKEKRPVTALQAVPEWNALLCLVDGALAAYALATFKPLAALPESKGCLAFHHYAAAAAAAAAGPAGPSAGRFSAAAVPAGGSGGGAVAVVLPKRRLLLADWESRGGGGAFRLRRDVTLAVDSPRALCLLSTPGRAGGAAAVLAFKKEYGLLPLTGPGAGASSSSLAFIAGAGDASSSSSSSDGSGGLAPLRLCEMDREHKFAVMVEIPPLPASHPHTARLVLSNGTEGVVFHLPAPSSPSPKSTTTSSSASASSSALAATMPQRATDERVTWSAPVRAARVVLPFLVALLENNTVDVHDISGLTPLQTLDLGGSAGAFELCACRMGPGKAENVYVTLGGAHSVSCLQMVPLALQVDRLVGFGCHKEALQIAAMLAQQGNQLLLHEIDLPRIHERYAEELLGKGDFEAAVRHFIQAETPPPLVLARFAAFFPPELLNPPHPLLPPSLRQVMAKQQQTKATAAATPSLSSPKAAAALLHYCGHYRRPAKEAADHFLLAQQQGQGGRGGEGEGEAGAAGAEVVLMAQLLDTLLVSAAARCRPPRREEAVALLASSSKGGNRCLVDTCAPLLAAEGPAMVEALLWLYRSKGEHRRTLGLLSEERCVAREKGQGWTLAQYHAWTADYLHALWHAKDPALPPLALAAAKPLLEANPKLGLSIFTSPAPSSNNARGPSSPIPSAVAIKSPAIAVGGDAASSEVKPRVSEGDWKGPGGALKRAGSKSLFYLAPNSTVALPLVSGAALAMAYLDYLVGTHAAPPPLHDELFLLLLTALLAEGPSTPSSAAASAKTGQQQPPQAQPDGEEGLTELGRLYQARLREFLKTSTQYHPERLLPALEGLPRPFLRERALLLSRLGRHEAVLRLYVERLGDAALAEAYCEEIWQRSQQQQQQQPAQQPQQRQGGEEDADVYLALLRVLLQQEQHTQGGGGGAAAAGGAASQPPPRWLSFLERNAPRLDAVQVLGLLPERTTPLQLLAPYLTKVLRQCATERRHKEVVHQLLRVEELKIQQELVQEQARRVTITEDTLCRVPTCRRPIGNTAILCYPNGVVVHFACGRNDLHTCPVTGETFRMPGELLQ